MPLFNGFRFSFNLSSKNDLKLDLPENNATQVYITGAYKVLGEEYFGSENYGEAPKKITPSMVKLPPPSQPNQTDPKVIQASKSTGDLTQQSQLHKLPPEIRKSTPAVSQDPRGAAQNNRQSTDLRNSNKAPQVNNKEQIKLNKKQLAERKKQEKIQAQQRAKEEKLRKEREKAELKERAKQEKQRIQREKAEAAKAKKEAKNKNNVPPKRTNPLAQGPNAPMPYSTNTLQSSISKASGPPPYEANNPALEAENATRESKNPAKDTKNPSIEASNPSSSGTERGQIPKDMSSSGNVSFAPPVEPSTWDMVAQHRVQVSRAPVGGAANKVAIKLQEPLDENVTAVTGRKSLYV